MARLLFALRRRLSSTWQRPFGRAFLVYALYIIASSAWAPFGGLRFRQLLMEVPLFLAVCAVLTLGLGMRGKLLSASSSAVLLIFYASFDALYATMLRPMLFSDILDLVSVWALGGAMHLALIVFLLLFFGCALTSLITAWRISKPAQRRARALFATLLALLLGSGFYLGIPAEQPHTWKKWREARNDSSIRRYGRTVYMLVQRGRQRENLIRLSAQPASAVEGFFAPAPVQARNVYMVMMESLVDPRDLHGAVFDRDPLHHSLSPWLHNDRFDLVISSVFGGNTAQTEFELLSGTPAKRHYGGVEHNNFRGTPADGFVRALLGSYHSRATIASQPRFFNAERAYSGHGLQQRCFFAHCEDLVKPQPGDTRLHDEDLLRAALRIPSGPAPVFHYIKGYHGHVPLHRNHAIRPDRINLSGPLASEASAVDLSNQFFYRTAALGEFITGVYDADPDAIVLIASDHLPNVIRAPLLYQHSNFQVPALLLDRGERIDINGLLMWQLPHKILRLLADSQAPLPSEEKGAQQYAYVMRQALGFERD